jgi:hypothetical protein
LAARAPGPRLDPRRDVREHPDVRPWLLLAMLVCACDGDGCNGGPDGQATLYCQRTIAGLGHPDGGMTEAEVCRQCCLQEVPYKGAIENGRCVCRR